MNEGLKFEIWLEKFYQSYGINTARNLHIYRPPAFRQADLFYIHNGKTVLVEAKHRFGQLEFDLRKEKKKKSQLIHTISNHIEETYERKLFIKADLAILITNSTFSPKFHLNTPTDMILIDGKMLEKNYREQGGRLELNESIYSIKPSDHYEKARSVVVKTTASDYISQKVNYN